MLYERGYSCGYTFALRSARIKALADMVEW